MFHWKKSQDLLSILCVVVNNLLVAIERIYDEMTKNGAPNENFVYEK